MLNATNFLAINIWNNSEKCFRNMITQKIIYFILFRTERDSQNNYKN